MGTERSRSGFRGAQQCRMGKEDFPEREAGTKSWKMRNVQGEGWSRRGNSMCAGREV